jgi:hypothetical protein
MAPAGETGRARTRGEQLMLAGKLGREGMSYARLQQFYAHPLSGRVIFPST